MNTTKLLIGAVALAAAYATSNAQAQNLSAEFVEIKPVVLVTGTFDNGNSTQDYYSGVLRFTGFDAFCVDPLQSLSFGQSLIYEIQEPSTLTNYDTIARLVGGYLASNRTDQDAAAVQWAIWEITTENLLAPSLDIGNVRISSPPSQATALLANDYLIKVATYTPVTLTYLTNSQLQDVVTWNVIPEPTSFALAALSGLLLLRRRR